MPDTINRVTYALDARVSRLTIRVTATGMLSMFGHNPVVSARGLSGEVSFVPETLAGAALAVRVPARTLSVESGINDRDRREIEREMHESVLETAAHPEITFESTRVAVESPGSGAFRAQVRGQLTLHGTSREVAFPVHVTLTGPLLRASGSLTLRQSDFGIRPVSAAGGALKVRDELECAMDVVARQQV